jgi:thioesterase domain-containing protein
MKKTMFNTAVQLQEKIHKAIPLSAVMQFSIIELNPDSIIVSAPLEPNINIHGTGFAGSLYSIGILAGWALSTHIMSLNDMIGDLVVGKADIKYRSPIADDFVCRAMVSEVAIQAFQQDFESNGKGCLDLTVNIGDDPSAVLQGLFVAKK